VDAQTIVQMKAWLLPPEGRAGWLLAVIMLLAIALLLFCGLQAELSELDWWPAAGGPRFSSCRPV